MPFNYTLDANEMGLYCSLWHPVNPEYAQKCLHIDGNIATYVPNHFDWCIIPGILISVMEIE